MFTNGQRIERHQVEPWVAEAFPGHPFFKAHVREAEETYITPDLTEAKRIRVTVTICDGNGVPLVVPIEQRRLNVNPNTVNSGAVAYFSLREAPNLMPQIEGGWAE